MVAFLKTSYYTLRHLSSQAMPGNAEPAAQAAGPATDPGFSKTYSGRLTRMGSTGCRNAGFPRKSIERLLDSIVDSSPALGRWVTSQVIFLNPKSMHFPFGYFSTVLKIFVKIFCLHLIHDFWL